MTADDTMTRGSADLQARVNRFFALDEELLADPYALYREMRDTRPVMRVGNVVAVSRYDDVKQIFRDPLNFSSNRTQGSRVTMKLASLDGGDLDKYEALLRHERGQIGLQDMPGHTRLRRFVNQVFSAATIAAMREQVARTAHGLLDELDLPRAGVFDLTEFTYRLPFLVVCRMLAIPEMDILAFRTWARALRRGLGTNWENLDEAYAATTNIEEFVRRLISERGPAAAPAASDLVAALVTAEVDGTHLTDQELITMFTVMLTSGNTNDMIANAVIALDDWPDQRALLLEDPARMRNAVEEFFRYCPSVHGVHRVAASDCEIDGFAVRAGETVRLMVASANHDPRRFEDPERLDVTRQNARQHMDFGFGIHTCLGQWLARLNIETALTVLLERIPEIRAVRPVRYRREYNFRGPERLLATAG
jgi:cytochrome P450